METGPGNRALVAAHAVIPSLGVSAEAILVAGPDGRVKATYGWEGLTGQSASDSLGDGWLVALDGSAQSDARQHREAVLEHGQPCCGEGRLRDRSRAEVIRWCVRTVPASDAASAGAAGIVISLVGVLDDNHRQPGLFSMFDPITDGTERAWLRACVRHAVLRLRHDAGALAAVLHVQLMSRGGDGPVTDLGVGGIAAVAGRFRAVLKPTDVLAAAGGAEFLLLCEDLSLRSEGGAIGARLARTLRAPVVSGGRTRRLDAAVGVAVTDDGNVTADLLIQRAGEAMERAKRRGRGPVSSFTRAPAGRPNSRLQGIQGQPEDENVAPALSDSGFDAA
jgi:GGDEF domain-containing protein